MIFQDASSLQKSAIPVILFVLWHSSIAHNLEVFISAHSPKELPGNWKSEQKICVKSMSTLHCYII